MVVTTSVKPIIEAEEELPEVIQVEEPKQRTARAKRGGTAAKSAKTLRG